MDEGDFLVFTYEGKMHFSIACFDRSCCERVDFPNGPCKQSTVAKSTKRPCHKPRKHNSGIQKDFDICIYILELMNHDYDIESDLLLFACEAADNTAKESAISFKSKYPHYKKAINKTYCVVS